MFIGWTQSSLSERTIRHSCFTGKYQIHDEKIKYSVLARGGSESTPVMTLTTPILILSFLDTTPDDGVAWVSKHDPRRFPKVRSKRLGRLRLLADYLVQTRWAYHHSGSSCRGSLGSYFRYCRLARKETIIQLRRTPAGSIDKSVSLASTFLSNK